jgi:hypothetical protein
LKKRSQPYYLQILPKEELKRRMGKTRKNRRRDVKAGPAVAMFLLISAVAHFNLSTIGYRRYIENLKKGMNQVRFYEYALSSSLMIVLIGTLIGLWDLGATLLIFTLNATMNLFGHNDGEA